MGIGQSNQSNKKKKNIASCFGCMQHDNNEHDCNELHIGDHKPQGKINDKSVAYLSEDEINFFKVASGRNVSAIRYYLRKGVNINVLDEDRTSPLHVASRHGSVQIVEELLNWGASPNITDCAGWTPLHVAAFFQRPLVCHILLKQEADLNLRNRDGQSALDLVRDQKTQEILENHWSKQYIKELQQEKTNENNNEIPIYQYENDAKTNNNNENSYQQQTNNCSVNKEKNDQQQNQQFYQQNCGESTNEQQQQKNQDQQPNQQQLQNNLKKSFTNGSFYQSENQNIVSNKSSFVSSQNLQQQLQQQFCSPKKHKYYLYFKSLKAKYVGQQLNVNEDDQNNNQNQQIDKRIENIDLQTLYSELEQQNPEFNKENCYYHGEPSTQQKITNANDAENQIDEYNQIYDENEFKNISQITYNNVINELNQQQQNTQKEFSSSANKFYNNNKINNQSPKRKNSNIQKTEICNDVYTKQKIKIKEYVSANQSIPFKLKTIYNTSCDAKKDLDFKMRKRPSRNPSAYIQTNKNVQNQEMKVCSPNPSMTSLFFLNKQLVSLSNLIKEKPIFQLEQQTQQQYDQYKISKKNSQKNQINLKNTEAVQQDSNSYTFSSSQKIIEIGLALFNYEPLIGLSYLILINYVKPDIQSISNFLQNEDQSCKVVKNKYSIGRLLTETRLKEFNEILHIYMNNFQFQMPFCNAIRFAFQHLLIENDPEKIDVVLQQFSRRYYNNLLQKDQKDLFQNADAVHMLAFAIVMFDIEHQQTKENILNNNNDKINNDLKTLVKEFYINVNGINDGEDFSKEFLNSIIENILNQQAIKTIQKKEQEDLKKLLLTEFIKKLQNSSVVGINICVEGKNKTVNKSLYIVDNIAYLILDDELQINNSLQMIQLTGYQVNKKSGKLIIKNKLLKQNIIIASFQTNPIGIQIKKKEKLIIKAFNNKENEILENNLKIAMFKN